VRRPSSIPHPKTRKKQGKRQKKRRSPRALTSPRDDSSDKKGEDTEIIDPEIVC
jgi:hypothetical protein